MTRLTDTYRNAAENSPLYGWTTSRRACFQGIVLIWNLAAKPHKDRSDYADSWVIICCWGEFGGGDLVVPDLKLRFAFKHGDVVVFRSTLLEHYIMPFDGERSSTIFFSHNHVMGAFQPVDEE
ncbi:hypothetical protein L211DRAFT_877800 [Terfezia boudieri ATCC MYA-4762]|uniref:2OGFeDO JBP1/TET oxygenase domain-containing protein n=1 Tax=Terfezia boudieri ATCC MYA-4762 TaxID=1051890 RepID=A0A3N4L5P6_9PEZI|nr:hypothetical protein L211DRAFT_877800 [Terfezia boudieri ATCC MYA-4762]